MSLRRLRRVKINSSFDLSIAGELYQEDQGEGIVTFRKPKILALSRELTEEREFWLAKLSHEPEPASLTLDFDRPAQYSTSKETVRLRLPGAIIQSLDKLTGDSPFLIYTALLAALKVCLYKYSGNDSIAVGSPRRLRQDEAEERSNALAIIDTLNAQTTFRDLLLRVRETLIESYKRQNYPFDYLLGDLGISGRESKCALFNVALAFDGLHGEMPDVRQDVTITFSKSANELSCGVAYNSSLFSNDSIRRFTNHFINVLQAGLENLDASISGLNLLTAAERQQLLCEWSKGETDDAPQDACIHQLFEARAQRSPNAVALRLADKSITYDELNKQANRLASYLQKLKVGPEVLVGIYMERSFELVVAMLGILKAGGAYLPLAPQSPPMRLSFMLQDAGVEILLTQESLLKNLPETRAQVICIDKGWASIASESEANAYSKVLPENLAYVIYTSGSTGQPKGVSLQHRGVCNLVRAQIQAFGLREDSRVLQFAPFSFDASVSELFTSLVSGGTLCLPGDADILAGESLIDLLREHAITTVTLPPTLLSILPTQNLPALETVVSAGEACSAGIFQRWSSERRFINAYGPTEATVCTTLLEGRGRYSKELPIGRPIANMEAYVLDERMEPVGVGLRGELYLAGVGLARGYLHRPDLTAERFLPHPYSADRGARLYRTGDVVRYNERGELEYVGRADRQVKVRGYRIELGEVEAALREVEGVREAAVVVREEEGVGSVMVAYVVAETERRIEIGEMRSYLKERLPEYMIPGRYVKVEGLPVTSSGKVDRRALPEPEVELRAGQPYAGPRTATEELLCDIWAEALGRQQVGIHDNFFELGGDSILGVQVIAKANRAGLQLAPKHMFSHQTVAELASVSGTASVIEAEQGFVQGAVPLTPVQHWFFEQEVAEPHHWNQSLLLKVREDVNASELEQALAYLIQHHDGLRLRFARDESGWRQFNIETETNEFFLQLNLSHLSEAEQQSAITNKAVQLQASLRLSDGPLVRAAFFHLGQHKPGRLLLIIHHLAVDGVSWRILLEDLQTACEQRRRGDEIKLPPKTTSFKRWAEKLSEHAVSEAAGEERDYWLKELCTDVDPLPVDFPEGENTEASSQSVTVALDADETRVLLQEVLQAHHTQITEVLLAALAQAFAERSEAKSILIDVEGHGREALFEDIDVTRTVGWFTAIRPVALDTNSASGTVKLLQEIKERLRRLPGVGLGYGLLRYLSHDEETVEKLRTLPESEISFNYLGQLDRVLPEASWLSIADEPIGQRHSSRALRPYLLGLTGSVAGERLRMVWTYSRNVHRRSTIEELARSFIQALRQLIRDSRTSEAMSYIPSDFPLAKLDQQTLDQLTGASAGVENIYPLSPVQQGILFHSVYAQQLGLYLQQLGCTFRGGLDLTAFRRAWQAVIDRHGVLRTSFYWEDVEQPLQLVHRRVEVPLQEYDWRGLNAAEQDEQLKLFWEQDRQLGFDFSAAPLMRLSLIRMDEEVYHFLWSVHHILLDGWSNALVMKEVMMRYEAYHHDAPLQLEAEQPYTEYIAWLQRLSLSEAEAFWRQTLKGFTASTPFKVAHDVSAPAGEYGFAELQTKLSAELTEGLQNFARRHKLTLNSILQGAWALLLSRYSGENDVLFGITVSGRPHNLAQADSMVGLFINTLPMRVQVSAQEPVASWLRRVQATQAELRQYEYSPLVEIHGWSEIPRGRPLFDSILVYENYPIDSNMRARDVNLSVSNIRSVERTNYPLTVIVAPGTQLSLKIIYNCRRFDSTTIKRMSQHLEQLLESISAEATQSVSELSLLGTEERTRLLAEYSGRENRRELTHQCLHELFEAQVARSPQAVALCFDDLALSYSQLNDRANQLAHFLLLHYRLGPDSIVALCLDRSLDMPLALLAILKAGAAYLPLDPLAPPHRLAFMLAQSDATLLLTQSHLSHRLPPHSLPVLCLDDEAGRIAQHRWQPVPVTASPHNLAYVIYTSGSTGEPKGVMCTHGGVVNRLLWMQETYGLGADDSVLQKTPYSFDVSVWEFFWPLLNGGRLVMARPGGQMESSYLLETIAGQQVSIMHFVPSMLEVFVEEEEVSARSGSLRLVISSGEALSYELEQRFMGRVGARLANLYGPTEASIDVTYWECGRASEKRAVPIGRPIANMEAYVLDERMEPVGVGLRGELYLAGVGLARGYLHRPDLTAERFLPHPYSAEAGARLYRTGDVVRYNERGELEYVGRADRQVKVRGYRIELGEVEAALREMEGVREAAVVVREEEGEGSVMVAYVVAETERRIEIGEVRRKLKERLPEYMIPGRYVKVERLPVTSSGKVDRRALPEPEWGAEESRAEYEEARGEVEREIAGMWAEVLRKERVGIHDNFFDLGGHSLHMLRIHSKLRKQFGRDIPIVELFRHSTVSTLARFISEGEAEPPASDQTSKRAANRQQMMNQQRQVRQQRRAEKKQRGNRGE